VLNHTEQEYGWAAGQLMEEFNTPSMSEMESITNMLNQMIVRKDEFMNRFERLGNKEYKKIHHAGSELTSTYLRNGYLPTQDMGMEETPQDGECCEPDHLTKKDIDTIINQTMP
jgi:hypothetical protein